jgi:hypothetical protein
MGDLLGIGSVAGQLSGLGTAAVSLVGVTDAFDRSKLERGGVEGSSVAVVGVDASQERAASTNDLRNHHLALVLTRNRLSKYPS